MTFTSLRSLRARQDSALTLVFGSDGQVSLLGGDGGTASQVPYTLTALSRPTSVSLIPNLEATSPSTSGFTPTLASSYTSPPSSSATSSYDPSSTTTDTDTFLPSIPTVNYPTPSPTPVTNPKDQIGAPFYIAMVFASISFIGCIAAFIAWLIRSRRRRRALEDDDPWIHSSDSESPFTDNVNLFEKKPQPKEGTKPQPYYLPASIVRRSSSNLLHTAPALGAGAPQDGTPHIALDARYPSLRRMDDLPSQNMPSSQTTRPGLERSQTGLSVQESTRTLGRLRVANRVPGDVTSGDEGGMNRSRLQNSAGAGRPDVVRAGESAMRNPYSDRGGRPVQGDDVPLEPPGPATLSWGRRMDAVAALRRTRRETDKTTLQTDQNRAYDGYLHSKQNGEPSRTRQAPAATGLDDNGMISANAAFDSVSWKDTFKSSFWQAVDAMTGNRSSDPEFPATNIGNGSRFTPAPQRIASRRSPISPIRPDTGPALPGTQAVRSQAMDPKDDLTRPIVAQEMPLNLTYSSFRRDESGLPPIGENSLGSVTSLPLIMSHLDSNISTSTHRLHPDSLRADTGSVYSNESAAARANLRKYGYTDSIPSTWSALGGARESRLNLDPIFLPLPRPISSSPRPLSVTPSQLTFESALLSSSVSTRTRTRTPAYSESDLIGSDISILRARKHSDSTSYLETASFADSMSRNGTIQSGRGTIGHGAVPSHPPSAASSVLSRKKGVTTRRKRPKLPPRASSSASSVQTIESSLSIREVAVRRALLERRKKVKAAESLKGRASRDTSTGVSV